MALDRAEHLITQSQQHNAGYLLGFEEGWVGCRTACYNLVDKLVIGEFSLEQLVNAVREVGER